MRRYRSAEVRHDDNFTPARRVARYPTSSTRYAISCSRTNPRSRPDRDAGCYCDDVEIAARVLRDRGAGAILVTGRAGSMLVDDGPVTLVSGAESGGVDTTFG